MLSVVRSQLTALSLRNGSGACMARSSAMKSFSTAATESSTPSENDDATAAFLDATEPDEMRTVKTMKQNIRYSPRKLTYLAQQV
jgi:hypothetical protein